MKKLLFKIVPSLIILTGLSLAGVVPQFLQAQIVSSQKENTPTPAPVVSSVNIEIKTPGTSSAFTIGIDEGMNACEILVKAKDEGKIASVTLDDSYLSTFNTLLVSEINGFSNYWVFSVNGESPMGCSLIALHSSDQIIWEFINGGQ